VTGEPTRPGPGHRGGDIAAYALGALEPAEAEALARHLEGCAICRDELEALRSVVDLLPLTAPAVGASPALRRRVRRAIAAEPRPGGSASAPALRRSWLPRWSPRPALAVAAAAVAAIAAALVIVFTGGGSATRVVHAEVTGRGSASLRISGGRGELVVRHVAPPPKGKIYEVWLVRGTRAPQPTSALFGVTTDGNGDVGVPGSLHGVTQVLVTPEPAGGSKVPTHAPVIAAKLS
jgi:anti-sigma-K factor RskA